MQLYERTVVESSRLVTTFEQPSAPFSVVLLSLSPFLLENLLSSRLVCLYVVAVAVVAVIVVPVVVVPVVAVVVVVVVLAHQWWRWRKHFQEFWWPHSQ